MGTLRPHDQNVNDCYLASRGRSLLERETSIIFNDLEGTASVWTFSPVVQRHLQRFGWRTSGGPAGPFVLPKTKIRFARNRPASVAEVGQRQKALRAARGRRSSGASGTDLPSVDGVGRPGDVRPGNARTDALAGAR